MCYSRGFYFINDFIRPYLKADFFIMSLPGVVVKVSRFKYTSGDATISSWKADVKGLRHCEEPSFMFFV